MTTEFLQKRPAEALNIISKSKSKTTQTIISKKTGMTYAHTQKLISRFEKLGIIKTEFVGRQRFIELTNFGIEIAKDINHLKRHLNKVMKL